jgi:hypothetical protein
VLLIIKTSAFCWNNNCVGVCVDKDRGKRKVHPRTGHEGPEGEQRYSSTLSLTSALCGWVVNATPRPLYARERSGIQCIGDWVGPRTGLDGCGKSRPPPPLRFDPRTAQPFSESLYRLSYPGSGSALISDNKGQYNGFKMLLRIVAI